MKSKFSKLLLGIIIASNFLALAFVSTQSVSAASYSATLDYLEYYYVSSVSTLYTNEEIYWSFSASNNVYLDVWILDDTEFSIFNSGGTGSGYHVSNYEGSSDSGTWDVAYTDVWYVIFLHADDYDPISTSVSMTVRFPGESIFSGNILWTLAFILVPIICIGGIIGLVIYNKKKRQRMPSPGAPTTTYQSPMTVHEPPQTNVYTPPQPEQPQPVQSTQPIAEKFCPYCGTKNEVNNRFCMNCGADILDEI